MIYVAQGGMFYTLWMRLYCIGEDFIMNFSCFSCVDSSLKGCPVYPDEGTLSEQLDYHWTVYNSGHYATHRAKKKALAFLEAKLNICPSPAKAIRVKKIKMLMRLKQESSHEDYIPSLDSLSDDTDAEILLLVDECKVRCYNYLGEIRACGFGDADSVMQTYCGRVFNEIQEIKQIDKIFKLTNELLNISYRIQHDPVSNRLRCETEAEVERLFDLDVPDVEVVARREAMLRDGIGNTSIEERAARYQGHVLVDPSLPQEMYRYSPTNQLL